MNAEVDMVKYNRKHYSELIILIRLLRYHNTRMDIPKLYEGEYTKLLEFIKLHSIVTYAMGSTESCHVGDIKEPYYHFFGSNHDAITYLKLLLG